MIFFILVRIYSGYLLENRYPTLTLIMAGGDESITYLGPTDLQSLVDFVNDETGRPKKVKDINS